MLGKFWSKNINGEDNNRGGRSPRYEADIRIYIFKKKDVNKIQLVWEGSYWLDFEYMVLNISAP
jgi:hypothetical protein